MASRFTERVPNQYSRRWFTSFLETIPEEWSAAEVAAIVERLPLPTFRRVLDICCGTGRHAAPLADLGYEVVGVDRDADAVATAEHRAPGATFRILDQRELATLERPFDAAMILWQSFGYFDSETNDRVLSDIASLLRTGGRLLLDVYHPDYVLAHTGTQTEVRGAGCRSNRNRVAGGRLLSTITFDDGSVETMDFELFDPADLIARAHKQGLTLVESCSWWDSERPPSAADQRYQLVLERRDGLWQGR